MPSPKGLRLETPGYRRWLTPDMTELRLRIVGFSKEQLRSAHISYAVTDRATERTATGTILIQPGQTDFAMPAPALHSSGELVMYLEDAVAEKVLGEARWRLTRLASRQLESLAYFDSRGVLFVEGRAFVPRVWEAEAVPPMPATRFKALADAGFNAVTIGQTTITPDRIAALANTGREAGLRLLVSPLPGPPVRFDAAAIDRVRDRVRALRGVAGIIGYVLPPPGDRLSQNEFLRLYHGVRATDPARFVIVHYGGERVDELDGYEDAVSLTVGHRPDAKSDPFESARLMGLPAVAQIRLNEAPDVAGRAERLRELRYRFYDSLSRGASGVILAGEEAAASDEATLALLAEAEAIEPLQKRGRRIAWPTAQAERAVLRRAGLRFWLVRDGADFLLAAIHDGADARAFEFPLLPAEGKLHELGHGAVAPAADGRIRVEFPPRSVRAYCTSAPAERQPAQ